MLKLLLLLLLSSLFLLTASSPAFGLKSAPHGEPVKLLELQMKSLIKGPYQELQYIFTYQNTKDHTLETIFHFPREQGSIFNKFEAIFGDGQTVTTKIVAKENNNPQPKSSELFSIAVGELQADKTVKVLFSVLQPLKLILNQFYEVRFPALTNQEPPFTLDQDLKEWNLNIEIHSDKPFSILSNPTHWLKPNLSESEKPEYKAFWNVTIPTDKDFIVYFAPERLLKSQVFPAVHPNNPNDRGFFLNIMPDLSRFPDEFVQNTLENQQKDGLLALTKDALEVELRRPTKSQLLFLIHKSDRFENLHEKLLTFLKTLPLYSNFRISFGSAYFTSSEFQISSSIPTFEDVTKWMKTIKVENVETDLLEAIKHGIKPYRTVDSTVIILTDGKITNSEEVVDFIGFLSKPASFRFCSLGIGHDVSKKVIQDIGNAGKCGSEFVTKDEDFEEKVSRLFYKSVSKRTLDLSGDFLCKNSEDQVIFKKDFAANAIPSDQSFNQWIDFKESPNLSYCELRFTYKGRDRLLRDYKYFKFPYEALKNAEVTDLYHKIAYRKEIRKLEQNLKRNIHGDEEGARKWIVDKSKRYQILSDFTSIVPVLQKKMIDSFDL